MEAVLLDAGGVLLLPAPDRIRRVLSSLGSPCDELTVDRAHYHGIAAIDVHGRLDWDVYFRAYVASCGVADGVAEQAVRALRRDFGPWNRVAPGALDGLRALSATGARIAVVSNSPGDVEHLLRSAAVCQAGAGRGVPVATVVDSGVVGVAKPDPGIFQIALRRLGVDASRAVHLGDTARIDVDGARAAGVRPVHLDPFRLCRDTDNHGHAVRVRDLLEMLRPRPA